ncbi:amidase [Thioclava sp. BHET1]|nr:amidase [Thioclava sp. BHET1]
MEDKQIWELDAVATAAAIRERKFTSREAVMAALNRLDAVNQKINAVVNVLREEALAAADAADAALANGDLLGPLHGVPITTKINVDLAGQPTTNGLVALKDAVARTDSTPVANLKAAGAVIIGQTNIPAFCYRWFTSNDLHGATLNPWNPKISTGGSSGGAAAAAATGIGTLAHGNDVAGSVRLPAAACGLYGMKATMGRIPGYTEGPVEKPMTIQAGASEGIIARSVRDIRLGLEVLARPDPRDPDHIVPAAASSDEGRPCRVALFAGSAELPVHPEVEATLRRAARWLEEAGYIVDEVAPPRLAEMGRLWMTLLYAETSVSGREMLLDMGGADFRTAYLHTEANLPTLDMAGFVQAWLTRHTIERAWSQFFQTYPLVLTPISCQPIFPVDYDLQSRDTVGEIMTAYSSLPAIAGLGLPAISVPAGSTNGHPAGVQIVSGWFNEERCLRAAEIMEAQIGAIAPIDPKAD